MFWNRCFVLISFTWIVGECQLSDNTPPTMWLDRNWQIPESEPVGSKIIQAHGRDNEGGRVIYGLEPLQSLGNEKPTEKLPFRIDPYTGIVYLNESLQGRGGQNVRLYVTASDGELAAKFEVFVNILKDSDPNSSLNFPGSKQNGLVPPPFLTIPNFNQRPKSPTTATSRQPHFQPKPNVTTLLRPIKIEPVKNEIDEKEEATTRKITKTTPTVQPLNKTIDQAVKTPPDLAVTVVPIISVCAVFLMVGIIAIVFRKKIHLGKPKSSKDDIRKPSSGAIVLPEDTTIGMQQWRGPTAFNNRYELWEREVNRSQASHQISAPIKDSDHWEFPRHRLKFFNILGEGAFGQVWKCEASDIDGKEGVSVVAVKTLKENANEKEKSDLLSELRVMKMLETHPNVVRLLGCCTDKEPIFLIMEYISKGKLQSYLRNSRAERYYNNMHGQSKSLTSRDLTSFVYQVAKGMEFLSANGIIHRDLAARNILITEEHTCKVADFGFARDVIVSHVYERKSEGRLPIRWMAPESLYDNIFSVKSDVWSFGVLIWEVVTLGSTPYPGLSAAEVMKKVRDGYRLDKPEHCRRELYNIMYYCWDKDPKQRPSFGECVQLLEKLLMTETDYIELERFPDHSYYNMMSLSGEKL
ncbi:tyrosine kinase receptor Cad96Ca isoform X2 [Tribolium castaneum]|uniref:receptor protein-tyrosine kinase n=1 Tax=Tribolium castaneum TaxID=7070 RepID=A0A139WN92_TRICA|nr:PREDICTED: tyrosine kinase receptor Cad96Ca isoform X2 [Tribolium castaneum]KYB29498.1 cadherin 96Ca [Tribolium castaneum]|eukprot:XP_008200976.1 PREDICTED: tyrosine kinase receptor Cad96Ca isoform X2 [Tribolium castaneum]